MAASASSSQVPCGKYDVFISFRGPDVRFGFLSHLEKELRRKSIDVYVDYRLERGDEISSALMKAIEGSRIALVIFSEDYASSIWCLEELVKIMDCKEADQQIVIPVFYLVDPSDIRHQKGTYEKATLLDEEKFKDKVKIWRSVLKKSANLAGYDLSKFENESKLVDAIVEDVLKKLEDDSPIVPNPHLIGFHQNFASVESLMEIKSQEVRIVGVWGMGGIGKTTLSRAIFDKFLSKFESNCFLENVREKSTKVDGLSSLREELFYKLLGQKDNINMNHAMRLLQRKKVLIVLDDVDNSKQLKVLVGQQCLFFGSGSRIIVTSRDKHVLRSGGILDKYIHEVNVLNFTESLELFCRHAFNQSYPNMGYQELSKTTVVTAQGIPLALEVLGSHFHSRDKAYWESELRKLKKNSHEQIQNILKISYDGLNAVDQEIFLDIAFFYVGECEDEITHELEACGFEAVSGIQNLRDKALIKLDVFGDIVMHDLIQEMAVQIVRKDRISERRSRLKDADEICDILKSNMGTSEIEGIVLNARQKEYPQCRADFFTKMKNLRIIKLLSSIELPFGLDSFPNKLRYLQWFGYPLESLPLGSYLENLVELHMVWSNVKKLWDGKQDLANLKEINLRFSKQLMELPDLSMAHRLEIVDLSYCTELRSVHPSVLSLHSLVFLNLTFCQKLQSLESETYLESDLLSLKQAINTMELHSRFDDWRNLRKLSLEGCSDLLEIPDNIKGLTKLEYLSLEESGVETLPACVNHLSSLRGINLRRCKRLKSILGLPPLLEVLDATECTLLEVVSSDSLLDSQCRFKFYKCVKLDESSLRFIEELTHSSITSACYPGSRVPDWMKYKHMTKASNTIEFTCDLERSSAIVFCCIAPSHLISQGISEVCCRVSYDDKELELNYEDLEFTWNDDDMEFQWYYDDDSWLTYAGLDSDHVFLWRLDEGLYDGKISCEFYLTTRGSRQYDVPAEACGVHIIYKSGQKRKSVADGLSPTKQLKNSGVSHGDHFICHPLQLKFLKQKDLSLIHFL